MADFRSMTLDKPYSEITERDLVNDPYIRPYYLEYMLSYFFGETKCTLNAHIYTIKLLEQEIGTDRCFSTSFVHHEIVNIIHEQFMRRFWELLFRLEKKINENKKSR